MGTCSFGARGGGCRNDGARVSGACGHAGDDILETQQERGTMIIHLGRYLGEVQVLEESKAAESCESHDRTVVVEAIAHDVRVAWCPRRHAIGQFPAPPAPDPDFRTAAHFRRRDLLAPLVSCLTHRRLVDPARIGWAFFEEDNGSLSVGCTTGEQEDERRMLVYQHEFQTLSVLPGGDHFIFTVVSAAMLGLEVAGVLRTHHVAGGDRRP